MNYLKSEIFTTYRSITLFFLCLFPFYIQAQESLKPISSFSLFQEKLKETAVEVESIEADFIQEKYLEVFSEKVISQGKFFFRKEDKIRMEYTSPISYLMVIHGSRLQITSEGKKNTISLGSNQMMNEVKSMLTACMTGDLSSISNAYKTEYLENSSSYIVRIEPKSKSVKAYITEMTIILDKEDMSVKTLRLNEPGNNYTEYIFSNRKYNTLHNDEKFIIH